MRIVERRTNNTYTADSDVAAGLAAISALGDMMTLDKYLVLRKFVAWTLYRQLFAFPERMRDLKRFPYPRDQCIGKVAEIMETPLVGSFLFTSERGYDDL